MEEKTKNLFIIIAFVYIILGILIYLGTSITGYVIYVQTNHSLEIIPNNFIYNSSLILIENNKISLYPNILTENTTKIITQNYYIISALRNNEDFTQEIIALDNNTVNLQKNKKFNIIFNNNLNNNNIIRIYIKTTGQATTETIYLCNYNENCNLNESYGSTIINQEGFYDIILQNLNQPSDRFNLILLEQEQPQADILKIDYIDSTKTEIIIYTDSLIQYSQEAEVNSKEINLNGTIQAILTEKNLNTENITTFYSIDQGINWNLLSNDIVNLNNSNIQLKFILSSTKNLTPEINSINFIYLVSTEETNLTENTNQTQNNNTIENSLTPSSGGSSGGGGGGGSDNREEIIQTPQETPTTKEEIFNIPVQQSETKEPIIIGQTEIPKPETNIPFLTSLTARIVYSGKNMFNFLIGNWWWLLIIIALLTLYLYLYIRRKYDKKQYKIKRKKNFRK